MLCPYSLLCGKVPCAPAYGRWIPDWPGLVGRLDCGDGVARIADPGVAGVAGVAGSAALGLRSAICVTQPRTCAARCAATLARAAAILAWAISDAWLVCVLGACAARMPGMISAAATMASLRSIVLSPF